MKTPLSGIGVLALLACGNSVADPIVQQTTSQHTYPVSASPRLLVRNIWGNVTVRAGTAREIAITVNERRSAPTQALFDESKRMLVLDVQATSDEVALIVGNPNRSDGRTDACRGCRVEYQFDITAPADAQIEVGTVTDGRVEIAGILGPVTASNVNGPVAVKGLTECANIKSVNGALDLVFARAPNENCAIETINGTITVALPANTSLDAVLNIGHGDIESDFDVEPVALPAKVEKRSRDDRNGFRFEQAVGVRIGAGGPTFSFASLNGDVRILQNK